MNCRSSHCRDRFRIGLLALLSLLCGCSDPEVQPVQQASSSRPAAQESVSGGALRELAFWEEEQAKRDQAIWSSELLSRQFEGIVLALWDRMNRSDQALSLLLDLPIESVQFGNAESPRALENGIQLSLLSDPTETRAHSEWQGLLRGWIAEGWQLAFRSCRQSGFDPSDAARPRSVFDLEAHLERDDPFERGILRGQLEITWRVGPSPDETPMEKVVLRGARWLSCQEPPAFREIVSREMMPHAQTQFIDPVIIADFDGNGRSDMLFSGCNVVYSGIEGGGLRSDVFVQGSKPVVYTSLYADMNGDGKRDYVMVDRQRVSMVPGGGDRRRIETLWQAPAEMKNPSAVTAGDIDNDGDLDLWLVQYKMPYIAGQMPTPFYDANDGFPSYLLRNDGRGRLVDVTESNGLAELRFRRSYSCSFVDLDGDNDLDLLNVSDFAGTDLYRNEGSGQFVQWTDRWIDESSAFGMAHALGDFDQSGTLDFLVIGMNSSVADRLDSLNLWPPDSPSDATFRRRMAYGNRLYSQQGERFVETALSRSVARSGWSWGVGSFDFDNDGDLDLYIANGHKTRASTRDYDEQFWTHDLFVANSDSNSLLNVHFRKVGTELYGAGYSYGGYQANAFFMNLEGREYVEVSHLVGLADMGDGRNVLCEDLDQDGSVDVLFTTSQIWPAGRQHFHLFQNLGEQRGRWIGFRLPAETGTGSWLGAEIRVVAEGQTFLRTITSGDGYRTQSAASVHIGLGKAEGVEQVSIRFPGGDTMQLGRLTVGQYHPLPPRQSAQRLAE